ncbi:MAG TPA: right-handed parallel beta-helix repeat-containing protein [Candidatus Hydrogenedentes bacterium]|nr:right-handed parallel beta-helix repeat-containing protein [Candidatus Hydrogenedentota bacterium]HQH53414.1 right-handed parallel beta-helix repeat-containing protein [Candidatus Hydrogenedentota bacterium]
MFTRTYLPHIAATMGWVCSMLVPGAAAAQEASGATTFYVAPNGNDAWTGRLEAPSAEGTDGPFATIAAARDAIRALDPASRTRAPIRVLVREGTYHVTAPVTFGPQDSGAVSAPITYEAYPGERPVIHGGRILEGWTVGQTLWTLELPEVRDGKWVFTGLYVNGEWRQLARTPNPAHPVGDYPGDTDYFHTTGRVMVTNADTGKEEPSHDKIRFQPGDLQQWESLADAWVVVFQSWDTSMHFVKSLDLENHILEFTAGSGWPMGYWQPAGQRFFVENLFEGLDQPGEWYLNRKTGVLYYYPLPGETPETVTLVAPVTQQLLVLAGKPEEGAFVEHLAFKGLRLHYGEYTLPAEGYPGGQAAVPVNAAIEALGARNCLIEACELAHAGNYGVWFRAGCQDNRLCRSEVADLGAGGVRIGEISDAATPNLACERNIIDNCFIHDGGKRYRGAVGAWLGRSSYNTLSHNEICDFRYSGISVGWSWGFAPSSAHHNIIEYNRVHHTAKGQLSDTGSIYTLGVSPGTIIRNNIFHDSISYPKVSGGWGIYFDEGSSYIVAENNLVYNTSSGNLHQHYGKENRVLNNIFAYSHGPQLRRSREEEHISFILERNIVYSNNESMLGIHWDNGNYQLHANCYWSSFGPDLDFAGRDFQQWQAEGHDAQSIMADPLFADPEHADFRLAGDSPALGLGFQPFDLSAPGLYGEPGWVDKPKQIPREPFSPPPVPEPVSIADDFEHTPVGETARIAAPQGEGAGASIRVTDETAASGSHSLKFTDAQGLQYAFFPYMSCAPHLRTGTAVGSFAGRFEPGTVFFHEWRDNRSPYRIGPSLWVRDGQLSANGQPLMDLSPGVWVRFEIVCALGSQSAATYDLTVTLPEQEPKRFEGLPQTGEGIKRVDWFGFVSNADATTVFYIDDVAIQTRKQ